MSASLRTIEEIEVTGHEGGLEACGPWRAMAKAVYEAAQPPNAEQYKAEPQRLTRAVLCSRAIPRTSLSSPQPEYPVPPVPPALVNKHGVNPQPT